MQITVPYYIFTFTMAARYQVVSVGYQAFFINLHNTSMPMLVPLSKMDNPGKKWFLAAADCYFVGTYHKCSVSLSLVLLLP